MKKQPQLDKYYYIAGWILIGLFVATMLFSVLSGYTLNEIVLPCLFHLKTGYYCPGCGGTRSVYYLTHGHLLKAAFYHPFVVYTAIVGGWFMVTQTLHRLFPKKITYTMHVRMIYIYVAIAVIVINCLMKNLWIVAYGVYMMGSN